MVQHMLHTRNFQTENYSRENEKVLFIYNELKEDKQAFWQMY